MKLPRVVIGCGLLLLTVAGLYGQTSTLFDGEIQDIVKKTRLQVGPFRFYPLLKFSYFSWVSNIFGLTNPSQALADLVITPSPELTAYVLYKRSLILSFTENPEYHFFLTQSRFRGFTNGLRAEAKILLFNRFILSGRYESTTQRMLGYVELGRVVQGVSEGYSVQVLSKSARGTSLTLNGSRRRLTFQDILAQGAQVSPALNHDELSAGAEIGYRLFSATDFFIRSTYAEYTFLEEISKNRTSKSYDILAGLRFPGNGRIRGALALGYKRFLPETQGERGFSGLVGDANLEVRLENLGIVELTLSRDNYFSLRSGFIYFINSYISSRLTVRTTEWLFLRLGGQYGLLDYPEQPILSAPSPPTPLITVHDTYLSAFGGFIVRLTRTFGVGLTYQRWLRDSPLLGENYNGYLISVDIMRDF